MNYPFYGNQFMTQPMQPLQSMQQLQTQQDERIWVQGIEGANAYLVAPNSFVRLWDSQQNLFYEKHTDASGRPYTEIFEYSKKNEQKPQVAVSASYESQLEELEKRITALEKKSKEGVKKNESNDDDTAV